MESSLCGKQSCPRVCVRVCHCPAGLARSRWLLGMLRNRREMSRDRALSHPTISPPVEYDSEYESGDRDASRELRSKVMTRGNYYHAHSNCTRRQALRLSWAEWQQVPPPIRHNFGVLNSPNHKRQSALCPTHDNDLNYHTRVALVPVSISTQGIFWNLLDWLRGKKG